ncbi:MAG: TetR family transcriptional regulator [Solirubrobacteraceae bacterium]
MAAIAREDLYTREESPRAVLRLERGERARVGEIQRARILAAMTQVACERGAHRATVANVVARAGVSRRTFYEEFPDSETCFLAALDQAVEYARARVLPLYEGGERSRKPGSWRERIRVSLAELLRLFDEQPQLARLLVVESLSGGPRTLERRAVVLAGLTAAVDAGRGEGPDKGVTRVTAEGVVGAVLSVIHTRLTAGEQTKLLPLLGPLMSTIVLPYLGATQARRELDRPAPAPVWAPAVETGAPLRSDPFKDAGMRLTYRTMAVLGAIAEHPGASNRSVGAAAGVADQGQMSKLLARLERLGLIANSGPGHFKGEPNAWSLTDAGRQLHQSIHAHTSASAHSKQKKGRE